MQINVFNETKEKIQNKLIKQIVDVISKSRQLNLPRLSSINLIIQSTKSITRLNKKLFNRDTPTDVISVNQPTAYSLPPLLSRAGRQPTASIGDVYICPKVIKSNAKKYKVSYNEELARIIIHGILHLLGYDHKKPFGESKEKMFKVQEKLLVQLVKHDTLKNEN